MKEYKMRQSRVLKKLRAGETAISIKLNSSDVRVCELAAMTGFDCVWSDMEHVPNDYNVVEMQRYCCSVYDVDLMVRVQRGSYSDYVKPLELGATGIMVPHIMSAQDARDVAKMTRFHPIGLRPWDGGNADGLYCKVDSEVYLEQSNSQRFVIVQIEDPEPLAELDEICEVEGIDMILFGPGDFSQAIGAPGQFDDKRLLDAREQVAKTARKHGIYAGTVGGPGNYKQLVDMGYNFLNVGADVVALSNYFEDIIEQIDKIK
jgi:4-hydroxy-2-oxoheptanedioate aldolase